MLFLSFGLFLGISLSFIETNHDRRPGIEWLGNPRSITHFQLESEGGTFDKQSLKGQWTIALFGFLHCPDVCPTSLSELARVSERLREMPTKDPVAFVFVSVDPERDSYSEVAQYARFFDANILGVTGSARNLKSFANDLGVQFKVNPGEKNYTVAHSVTFSIVDPNGALSGRFRPGFDLDTLVKDFTNRQADFL
nr:SCO family protein [Pseudoteredinibacter isoporae]